MIVLDTNVISEPLRGRPEPKVVAWLDAQAVETLAISAVTLAEIRFGIACLPTGRRRSSLHERFEGQVLPAFGDRVLAFDETAASAYAELRAGLRSAGVAASTADAMIAATAVVRGAVVATRDRGPFVAAGLEVIDPFG